MKQIVIFNNECTGEAIESLIDQLSLASDDQNVSVIGSSFHFNHENVNSISIENQSLPESIAEVLKGAQGDSNVLFIIAQENISADAMRDALVALSNSDAEISTCIFNGAAESCELPELSADTLIRELSLLPQWPLALFSAKAQFAQNIEEAANAEEFIGQIIINGLANHASFATQTAIVDGIDGAILSGETTSRLLQAAVNSINIEELFPNHAWETHQEESAAACYHTLAAAFIKLNDYESAMQCLAYGDRLEDSPRSLALKGIIALNKGETLNAVANMVSSLQEYERRKKDSKQHYLSFMPKDLEQINSSLQSGLSALNKRDNDTAVNYFTDAVFNFDSFYSDCGLVRR
ncbi:MAG: hypothetical protein KDD55_01940 [Bdellovibrionales bacterium]|nr:hypothetical protein [Bdellovibrionales bacterium]